jgi:hypothetical protein
MTATLPMGWRGRLLALGLLSVALAILCTLAVAPLLDLYAVRAASLEARRALVAKLNAIEGQLPALRKRVAELRAAADSSRLTLDGASDAVASAGLQGHIAELAAAAGMTVGSTESLPAQTQSGYHRLGLRVVLSGPYDSLVKLLGKIETTAPPLVVDNLQMHSFQRRPGAAAVSALDASFEVYGFRADETTDVAKR